MAETQEASTGWNGEVWMSSDDTAANLTELSEVRSFTPGSPTAERVETTTLKSPNRRRQYTKGMIDSGEAEIVINARRGSDTYIALKAALEDGGDRFIRFNYPELGVLVWTDDVLGEVTSIDEGEVAPDSNMEMTITVSVNAVVASAAYVEPA
ncbi:phage tail tube protein [Alteriqipengyuania lutimaris]|uniref:Lambda phage tail tube protein N-terminal domain-containing protein n=1 Tax=Alteriqipengyuania lutimaris TaxID=1538146 RepID=A0A395LJ56_9SPHN|nr:phage tail tube protein [Alteriqipengyuania lutimaris]MBB3034056.1 hypothetical protein [Alteriqipengyuania lutimaris]RDS77003.1 hypothetical protein DL238_04855 [Alteriqipengyuania lutimaris]